MRLPRELFIRLMIREDELADALRRGEISGLEYFARVDPMLQMTGLCQHGLESDPQTAEETGRMLSICYKDPHPCSRL